MSGRSFRLYDTTMCITAHGPAGADGRLAGEDWPTFNDLKRALRRKGFRFRRDPLTSAHYRRIARYHHLGTCPVGRHGELCCHAEVFPVGCRFTFYQEIVKENPKSGRYDFNKRQKMPYVLGKKFEASIAALRAQLLRRGFVEHFRVESPNPDPLAFFNDRWDSDYERKRGTHRFERGPDGWPSMREISLECWGGARDRDGAPLEHGAFRYFRDRKGYLMRGRVYGGINGMWMVVYGPGRWDATHLHASELFLGPVTALPRKVHPRPTPFAHLLKRAVERQDFERAIVLRDLLKERKAA